MKHRMGTLAVFVLLALVLLPSRAAADQRQTQVLIGASFVKMRFDEPVDVAWRNSLTLGVDFGVPVFPERSPVQLRGAAFLVPRGGNIGADRNIQRLKLLYVDLAPLIDWELKPAIGAANVHLLFGPSLGLRLTASAAMNGQSVDPGQFKRIDVGLAIGANFTLLPKKVDMQVVYIHGFSDLYESGPNQARNRTLLVMFSPSMWR